MLLEEHANVYITDPKALKNARIDLAEYGDKMQYVEYPYDAVRDADAIFYLMQKVIESRMVKINYD